MHKLRRGIEQDPGFVEGIVLEQGEQSAQSYRACANLVHTHTCITMVAHPTAETGGTLDALQGCQVFSTLDIKAGFSQLPHTHTSIKICRSSNVR